MGWSAQDIEKLRKQNNGQKSTAGTGQSAAPKSTTAPARSSGSTGWSAEKIDALRTGSGTKPAAKSTDAWVNRSAGTSVRSTAQKAGTQSAGKSNQNPTSGSLSAQVLGQMTGTQSVQTTKKAGSKLPKVERTGQPEWLGTGKNSAPAAKVLGTGTKSGKTYAERNNAMPMQSASGAMASAPNAESVKKQIKDADAKRVESWYARDAQQLKQETEELKATDKFSDFDRLNQWMDADPQHRQLVRLLRTGKGNKTYAERNNAMQPISESGAMASAPTAETSTEKREYTDAELLAKGYSRKQIREARQYIADFDALPDWQRAARRISNTIGGIVDTVASAPLMAGETAVRSVQNAAETGKNWNELQESVKSDDRQWKLLRLMTGGKTQYAGRDNAMQLNSSGVMAAPAQSTGMAYTDEELKAKGYSQSEIDRMRARISGAKVSEGIDPEKSLGYQMYKRGQQLNEAAQAGMSPIARQLMGVTTSAAENLAVAGISPALVLPVLSAQGGAESMGQSIEKGESAGKTLAGGLAKFGAGWAINSVGAADLARTMGSDYAKDTLAGKLADVVRSVADNGVLAQQYPTVANAVSGGIDNAMQAFVETYADKAIDAALGDAQAAEEMFSRDTFLQALESGLSGGASGALGGAVGTQLGRMSAALETADSQTVQRNEPSPSAQGADSSPEGRAFETERQAAANDRQVGNAAQQTEDAAVLQKETAPAASETVTEQTAVSDDPAARQLAEAMDSGTLTSRTIKLFTPNAANEANRAAFAEAYGMELPETAAQTRQVLRQMEAERSTAQSAQEEQQAPEDVKQEQTGETQVLDPEMAARAQSERQAQDAQKRTVENTGETVETPAVSHSLDSSLGEGAFAQQAEPAALRETAGLEVRSEGAQKSSVQRELLRWKVSEGAAQTLSRNMPTGIADESRYAAAASSLYRLGQMEDVTTFDKAMELAKGMNGLAVNTDYVLAQPGGAAALKIAWLQGKGEAEAGAVQTGTPGGALSAKSVSGSGRVLYKGAMRTADEVATKLIELNARATDTDAVLKAVLEGDERVKAYVDTAAGQIFFADSAGDVFGTVLHEDWHWYNALDTEGAQAVQQHVMEYLAKSEGFENIDELIRNKLSDYAQQGLTYGEAAEELVADAWRGIFDSEESFKRWVEFQRGQAEKNAGRAGTIRKVMNAVKDLLSDIVSRAKEVLAKDPENRAALKAQRLAEAEKRALQDEYFAHAEKAMENLRAAKENAAALENKGAAVKSGVKFQLAEQADRDAKRNEQQQASRVIAEKAAALDTLSQFFGLTKGVNVSRSAVEELAGRWLDANGSKADRTKLTQETEVLVNYLKADGADMNKAQALAETLAGEIQDGATYRNTEQWDEYQDLHKLEYTVSRDGQAKAELVKRYGSWSEAVAEARRHGVTLRQADGVRDGNPAELYESLVNDRSAAGGALNGESALWKAAAEKAGVAGALSMKSTEWLDVLMNLHDAIKPKTMSRFADDAEYEDAKVELAGRIIGDIMQLPQLNDAEAIFEGIQRNSLAMAKAAAGSDERAAEVEKGLKDVQKAQSREFGQRLAQNQRAAGRNAEVQQTQQLQKQLDKNLKRFGVDAANAGDLNEKLTVLRESYEREMKAESKRMKAELQQMRDEARLELRKLKSENAELARQAKGEQQRADKAEYSLMAQEDEVRERDLLNQQRAAEWYREQGERLATERQVMQQQRDEEIAIAKRVAEKRVQRARDGRKMDELKRSVRRNAAALNQMVLRPSPGKYVSQRLIVQAVEVAKIADLTVLNDRAVNQLTRLQNSIKASMGSKGSPTAMTTEWEQTGVPDLITELQNDLTAWKDAKLADLQAKLAEAEALPYSEKALALQERLRKRIRETESRTYLPMTVDQMRMLRDITGAALTVIRNENKTVSLEKAEEVSRIAEEAAEEVKKSKGNHPGGALDGVQNLLTKYNLDMLGAERVLRMLGGYKNGGQMEKIGQMLNDGQYRQTKITIEGEKLFADVTGAEHAKEAQAFAGPGADLVDVGLRDTDHNAVPLTHAQLCSLYMHLQNKDSLEHLMRGGMVVPDAQLYSKGDVEQAYQKGQLVQLGMLSDGNGEAMADTILNTLEAAMTDYDRAWCADMKEFFGNYTTKLINETSLQLVGYKRATVQNYYPIEVHKADLATEIEGVKLDATIEGRGFLKNRVKSSQPILLEECSSVVQRSLRDTAAYAGLAAPIRDVQKILNAGVETRDGVKTLKNGVIKEQWGTKAVSYLDDLLTDLQTTQRHRSNSLSRMLSTLRGNYAGAVLTLNPGVAIAQAASLPTAAAVLGGDTMAAVVPFVKNLSPKQKAALEAEIAEHGDVLLQWRQRGTGKGELQSIGKRETLVQKGMDKVPGWLTGWINGMDEITVAALWEGSKAYVKNHAAEFEGAGETGSPAYWEAVNRTYQKVIEQTQPNYTVMQRAGIQRNPDEMVKTFTMFTTQRFQNAGILIDAVGDWKAQAARYKADASDANKAELQRATKQRDRAILSQAAQVAVFAMMKIGADFLLHRWDREQDENGDVTLKSMVDRFFSLSTESTMGNFLFGSELYSLIDNAIEGKDYDVISATNISAVNDMASDVVKFTAELKKDTSEMDEAELEKHHKKLMEKGMALIENGFEIVGVPYGNGRKMVDAVRGYWDDAQNVAQGGKFSFNSLPESATGQYDRLYNAYASGDADEAQAAVEKLVAMGKEGEIYKQLKTRLKKYDADTRAAAKAQMEGNEAERYRLETETIEALYDVLGIRKNVKEDAPKREAVIDCVTGAVNALETEMLKGDAGDMYADLSEAVDSRKAQDVQAEYDRLMKAGRTPSSVKSKLTELAKPEYLAGSDADKQQLADVLLALTDTDGKALYTEKTFAQWEKAAEKAAQAEPEEDPYALLR